MNLSNLVILLIEDDPNDVILMQRAIMKGKVLNPLQVISDGEQAIHYLAGKGIYADRDKFPLPVLILLDLKLPRKDGFEVLKWIKSRSELTSIPVVILTSSERIEDIQQAYDLRANSYLVKPVDAEDLVKLFATLELYCIIMNRKPDTDDN
ncbi:MAG: response regulator [candidate division KSB1 bacterium]|nr:response regulator [candidate division KSB1 bacterium]